MKEAETRVGKEMRGERGAACQRDKRCRSQASAWLFPAALLAPALLLVCLAATAAGAADFGRNLVVNGGGEGGAAASNAAATVRPLPGWDVLFGNATAVVYGATGSVFLTASSPRPPRAGAAFFAGGPMSGQSVMVQRIALSPKARLIDRGAVRVSFSAWLGGGGSEEDTVLAFCNFLDAQELVLSTLQLDGPNSTARGFVSQLMPRLVEAGVPAGAVSAEVVVLFNRTAGSYNDGYADEVMLVLSGPCDGDFNIDGGIDGSDVDAFFADWQQGLPSADINDDGGVDGADVTVFLQRWEQAAC